MGKKSTQKDRLFLTNKEWKEEWGGFKEKSRVPQSRLPFYCCNLSFTNFEDPVCTEDGTIFEVTNIVPYINKHHTHPVTGKALELADLVALTFHKNTDGEYECPVLKKVFTPHSHIVAIKTSGNVFAYEAVQKFNIKMKSWNDLLTNEAFTKADIIHLHRPNDTSAPVAADFDHVKKGLVAHDVEDSVIRNGNATMKKVLDTLKQNTKDIQEPTSRRALIMAQLEAAIRSKKVASSSTAAHHTKTGNNKSQDKAATGDGEDEDDWRLRGPAPKPLTASYKPGTSTWDTDDAKEAARKVGKKALAAAKEDAKSAAKVRAGRPVPFDWWHANYAPRWKESVETTGAASRALTSTVSAVATKNERTRKLVHRDPKEKGYLTLNTNKGHLNLELHCDLVPRACENFIALCDMGYFNGVAFHRSIRNFMIQGGDPSETGTGGESIYGRHFEDEMDSRLVHDRRGVLAMANSGKNTNGSQFYILYKSARHLDYKHVVFGAVVGGLETLTALEAVKTDDKDCPVERVEITGCKIHKNPYVDMLHAEQKAEAEAAAAQQPKALPPSVQSAPLVGPPAPQGDSTSQGKRAGHSAQPAAPTTKRAKVVESDFDAW